MACSVSKALHMLTLAFFAILVFTPAAFAAEVGDQTIDLAEINRIIDQVDGALPPQDDPGRSFTLEEAIKVALEHNLQLQIAALDVEQQRPAIAVSKAKFHPVTGLSFGADGTNDASIKNSLTSDVSLTQAVPSGASLSVSANLDRLSERGKAWEHTAGVSLTATQPLLKGGRTYVARRDILDAGYDHEILQFTLQSQVLNVTAGTKIAYYEAILTDRLIDVTASALVRDKDLIEASRALFDAGRVNKRDVFSAEIKLAEDQARLAKDKANSESAQNRLRDVLGLPIDMTVGVTAREVPFDPVEIAIEDWIRSAMAKRPEILDIRKQLEKQELDVKVRRNSVLPSLDLVGSYSRSQTGPNVDRAFDLSDHAWTAGLNFSVPFGNVAARSQLTAARTARARLERQYVALERAIELQVRDFEIALRRNIAELKALTKALEQARAKREIASVRFKLGLANNFDVTDADTDLVNAETDLLSAITDYASNLALIEAAIVRQI